MGRIAPFIVIALVLVTSSASVADAIHKAKQDVLVESKLNKDESVMARIAAVNDESDVDLFESDIVLPEGNGGAEVGSVAKRNARRSRKRLWKDKKVPYTMSQELLNNWYQPTILRAMDEFHAKTCVRFMPRTTEGNWIEFVKDKGCWSSVGQSYWTLGGQRLSLGDGCNITTTVMHELLHALGFWHEQSRPDRNQYVEILWENIEEGKDHNFLKYSHFEVDNQEKPYDFQSIMHYGNKYFSKNGLQTIRAITQPSLQLGQTLGFSQLDIDEVNKLYDCNGSLSGWSSWSSFTPCDQRCHKQRERFCTSTNPSHDCPGESSYGVQHEIVVCGVEECDAPVDGHWGRWSSWGSCSSRCGPGTRSRSRACDDPVPRNNGRACVGSAREKRSCTFQSCGLGPSDCEFELNDNGFCVWTQDTADELDWVRKQGPTKSSATGPVGDHTSGVGHYLYVEASFPAKVGDKARLLSQTFPGSNASTCLILSYNMHGSGMGSLSLYVNNTMGNTRLWSEAGDRGEAWHTIHIDVQSSSNYQVIIEGVRGSSFRSDIAIDDVIFINGSCSDLPMRNLGCYNSYSRPLESNYDNFRKQIDWYDMAKTVKKCGKEAKDKGFKVFAVEFYGECWSSNEAKRTYNRDGASKNCWNGVGKHFTYQAYELL